MMKKACITLFIKQGIPDDKITLFKQLLNQQAHFNINTLPIILEMFTKNPKLTDNLIEKDGKDFIKNVHGCAANDLSHILRNGLRTAGNTARGGRRLFNQQ